MNPVEQTEMILTVAMTFSHAIDAFIGKLARESRRQSTLETYRRLLNDFADAARDKPVEELVLADYERFLDRWTHSSPSTLASGVSLVKAFSEFLWERGVAETHVAHSLKRPKRLRAEDLNVVTISSDEVARLIDACEDWQELLCVTTAAYLGPRRRALALVRRADVDLLKGTVRFVEKGGKVVVKPAPNEYLAIVRAAEQHGVWASDGDYLIPSRRPRAVRRSDRSDKVIWNTIKRVAARAGVVTHVHALRAAFAVQFDEAHPDQVIALKELMGHSRLETTLVYLRRKNKARAMESVRDLSFSTNVFPSFAGKAHTGFEPVLLADVLHERLRRKLDGLKNAPVRKTVRCKASS